MRRPGQLRLRNQAQAPAALRRLRRTCCWRTETSSWPRGRQANQLERGFIKCSEILQRSELITQFHIIWLTHRELVLNDNPTARRLHLTRLASRRTRQGDRIRAHRAALDLGMNTRLKAVTSLLEKQNRARRSRVAREFSVRGPPAPAP